MFNLIKEFPEQLLEALRIGEKVSLKTTFNGTIKNIVVSGLGGSGIGGNILAELLRNELAIPVIVNKSYFLPAFVDSSSLVIVCSYSGNTEEMISCADQALSKGLRPICITSGGKLEALAVEKDLDLIKIPAGFPPRSCLGYSVTQLFFVLQHYGLIDGSFKPSISELASFLKEQQEQIMESAEQLAHKIRGKVIIAYTEDKYESTVLRLKQQINENGKMHCWHNVVPELNHNELVGWREANRNIAVLIFRSDNEFNRNRLRLDFTKEVATKASDVFEIEAKGKVGFEKRFYLIHFGDWLSYYLAVQQGYDPTEIDVLNKLKNHLSSIKP